MPFSDLNWNFSSGWVQPQPNSIKLIIRIIILTNYGRAPEFVVNKISHYIYVTEKNSKDCLWCAD